FTDHDTREPPDSNEVPTTAPTARRATAGSNTNLLMKWSVARSQMLYEINLSRNSSTETKTLTPAARTRSLASSLSMGETASTVSVNSRSRALNRVRPSSNCGGSKPSFQRILCAADSSLTRLPLISNLSQID